MTASEVNNAWNALLQKHFDLWMAAANSATSERDKIDMMRRAEAIQDVQIAALGIGNEIIRDLLGNQPSALTAAGGEQKENDNG